MGRGIAAPQRPPAPVPQLVGWEHMAPLLLAALVDVDLL